MSNHLATLRSLAEKSVNSSAFSDAEAAAVGWAYQMLAPFAVGQRWSKLGHAIAIDQLSGISEVAFVRDGNTYHWERLSELKKRLVDAGYTLEEPRT